MVLHASSVALNGRGILIRGASGSGKSSLALALLARGANLIADDRTCVARRREGLLAWSPQAILGQIESRGIGILTTPPAPPSLIFAIVDLDRPEAERVPPDRKELIAGVTLRLVFAQGHPFAADALMLMLADTSAR